MKSRQRHFRMKTRKWGICDITRLVMKLNQCKSSNKAKQLQRYYKIGPIGFNKKIGKQCEDIHAVV